MSEIDRLVILKGNLAPDGAVAQLTDYESARFDGTARLFRFEAAAPQSARGLRDRRGAFRLRLAPKRFVIANREQAA